MIWVRRVLRALRGPDKAKPEAVNPDLIRVKSEVEWLKVEADKVLRQRALQLRLEARRGRR